MVTEQKNKDTSISIIIATYNAGDYIRECLSSISSWQKSEAIEIIAVDGGSTDNTLQILKEYKGNITWTSEPDKGIYDALNKGAAMATGRWLYFLGSDDRLLPGFEEMASKLKDENTIYYGDTEAFYTGNKPSFEILHGRFDAYRLAKYCINHQAVIYPAKVFSKYHYNLRYKVFADYALNIQVWGDKSFKKMYYPINIAAYHMGGFSSVQKDEAFKKDKPALIKKYMGWGMYFRFLYKRYKKKLLGQKGFE
ncbi:MAG: glycosyltransferase family 2 protein [Agriterribacter sp.]